MPTRQRTNLTAIVEARVDVRDLAACAKLFTERGVVFTNKSQLIRLVVELVSTIARDKVHSFKGFSGQEEAYNYLKSFGIAAATDKIAYRNMLRDIAKDESSDVVSEDDIDAARQLLEGG